MKEIRNRIKLYITFWKSTLSISIPISTGLLLLGAPYREPSWFAFLKSFCLFLPIGLLFYLLYKEISYKEDYYFYHNRGISRVELWITSTLLYYSLFVLTNLAEMVWRMCWK